MSSRMPTSLFEQEHDLIKEPDQVYNILMLQKEPEPKYFCSLCNLELVSPVPKGLRKKGIRYTKNMACCLKCSTIYKYVPSRK